MRNPFGLAARRTLAAVGFVIVATFGLSSGNVNASIVASLGSLSIGANEIVTCTTSTCTTTVGSSGGALPAAGGFTHQVLFDVAQLSSAVAINSTLTVSPISVTSITLYQRTGGGTGVGPTDATGVLVASGISTSVPGGVIWSLAAVLNPINNSFFLEIIGSTSGTQAQYTQQVAVSAVPLPPALILFATALFGMIGVGRIRRRRKAVAA